MDIYVAPIRCEGFVFFEINVAIPRDFDFIDEHKRLLCRICQGNVFTVYSSPIYYHPTCRACGQEGAVLSPRNWTPVPLSNHELMSLKLKE